MEASVENVDTALQATRQEGLAKDYGLTCPA